MDDPYRCRACGSRRWPVLSLVLEHERRCAKQLGMRLEPRTPCEQK